MMKTKKVGVLVHDSKPNSRSGVVSCAECWTRFDVIVGQNAEDILGSHLRKAHASLQGVDALQRTPKGNNGAEFFIVK